MSYAVFTAGPFETNAYVLFCPSTKKAVFIDVPPSSFSFLIDYIEKHELQPSAIWLTHSHWDHIADTSLLKNHYQIPVSLHPDDKENLEVPGSDQLPCWIHFDSVTPTSFFSDGQKISLGNLEIQVIHTPGHTPGGICFYLPNEKLLFSGDTLFSGTYGNVSFPTSKPALMWKSLGILAKLPPDTFVLPGHGPITSIGKESWLNQYI